MTITELWIDNRLKRIEDMLKTVLGEQIRASELAELGDNLCLHWNVLHGDGDNLDGICLALRLMSKYHAGCRKLCHEEAKKHK